MNIVIAIFGVIFSGVTDRMALAVISAVCIWAFGFVINDVFDAEFDKKKKNNRNPVSSGLIRKSAAKSIAVIFATMGIIFALLLPPTPSFLFLVLLLLFYLYSAEPFRLKERYPFDITFHGMFGALTFLASYALAPLSAFALLVSAVILIASTIAELLQEIRDYAADKSAGFSTAVIKAGIGKTIMTIKILFIAGLCLSVLCIFVYFPKYLPLLLSVVPFAKFLFFDSVQRRYFEKAMAAGVRTEIAFLILFAIVTLVNLL